MLLASDDIYMQGIENLANPVCNKSCRTYQFFMMCYQKRRNTRQICFHSLSKNWKFMTVYQKHAVVSSALCEQSCFQKQQILVLNFTQVSLWIFCWFASIKHYYLLGDVSPFINKIVTEITNVIACMVSFTHNDYIIIFVILLPKGFNNCKHFIVINIFKIKSMNFFEINTCISKI